MFIVIKINGGNKEMRNFVFTGIYFSFAYFYGKAELCCKDVD